MFGEHGTYTYKIRSIGQNIHNVTCVVVPGKKPDNPYLREYYIYLRSLLVAEFADFNCIVVIIRATWHVVNKILIYLF